MYEEAALLEEELRDVNKRQQLTVTRQKNEAGSRAGASSLPQDTTAAQTAEANSDGPIRNPTAVYCDATAHNDFKQPTPCSVSLYSW